MAKLVRFNKSHIPEINSWYVARKMASLNDNLFPDIGYLVHGVGAGFIYQTDSALCFIDGYISHPLTNKEERKAAFDEITKALIMVAKEHGFDQILAYTKNPEIKRRCERFQFNLKGTYDLYVRGV